MFKKLAVSAIASALLLANLPSLAQTSRSERWVTIGKTSSGGILSLNINSVETKAHGGNWLWFSYRVTDDKETREHTGSTGSCIEGTVSDKSEWLVDSINTNGDFTGAIKIKADSTGSQALLKRVCQLGNSKPDSQNSFNSPWVVIGKTSTGETLSLDLSSAQFTGYGEATVFTYKFTGNVATRINTAVTESCEGITGKLRTDSSLEWFVNSQNGKETQIVVKAESQASKEMLGRVCHQALVMFQRYGIQN
ncbi:MAG: hypothetical protein HWQ38_05315 [Nostoc sp. NMS7]|uniref:hypothetical protein n=1 Tax=Nostoc sp. NMS7 TaxID=2815391 RepID=UPI0025DCBB59|nr:hypothetical protein [Nostoc sp. NMS7]MBN3945924.1 hypothetical protein [Nostoc sp. NMS7]